MNEDRPSQHERVDEFLATPAQSYEDVTGEVEAPLAEVTPSEVAVDAREDSPPAEADVSASLSDTAIAAGESSPVGDVDRPSNEKVEPTQPTVEDEPEPRRRRRRRR